MAKTIHDPIEDPLWELMLYTHGCFPSCGCGVDFVIDAQLIGGHIEWIGEEAARLALRQLDDLISRGDTVEEAVGRQCNRIFRPPETLAKWLRRWRVAIAEALRDFRPIELPPVAEAEAVRLAATIARFAAQGRWNEQEQRAKDLARQNPDWCAADQIARRAYRKLLKPQRSIDPDAKAKLQATIDSARAVMDPIEAACRSRDSQYAAAVEELKVAQNAEAEARSRLALARVRAERAQPPASAGRVI